MCKLGFVRFDGGVTQARRREAVLRLLRNSWEMGNKDGVGVVSWDAGEDPVTAKALGLEALVLPDPLGRNVLVHARKATCGISLENTHPMAGGGAFLVHNGIVHPLNTGFADELGAMVKTTNDSELILKAYLSADRDLKAGLAKVGGWANVALWDARRSVLSLFPDGHAFQLWRQDGCAYVVQEQAQVSGLVGPGIGRPYEHDTLAADKVYEFHLPAKRTLEGAWAEAVKEARPFKLSSGYSAGYWQQPALNAPKTGRPYVLDVKADGTAATVEEREEEMDAFDAERLLMTEVDETGRKTRWVFNHGERKWMEVPITVKDRVRLRKARKRGGGGRGQVL